MFVFSVIQKYHGQYYLLGEIRDIGETGLTVKFGQEELVFWPFESISEDTEILSQEFARWKEANDPLPTIEFVKAKAKEIQQALDAAVKVADTAAWSAEINQQNRRKSAERALEAVQMEAKKREEEGSNPFSRKKCNPRMETNVMDTTIRMRGPEAPKPPLDLFDAHNFDIEIDVNTDTMGMDVSSPAIPAPITRSSTSSHRK